MVKGTELTEAKKEYFRALIPALVENSRRYEGSRDVFLDTMQKALLNLWKKAYGTRLPSTYIIYQKKVAIELSRTSKKRDELAVEEGSLEGTYNRCAASAGVPLTEETKQLMWDLVAFLRQDTGSYRMLKQLF